MSKGEVPIPYIIALVLAIVVIGLVVYWLYFSGGDFYRTITEYSCRSKMSAYCSQWKLGGDAPKPYFASSPTDACPVSQGRVASGEIYAPECCGFDWALGDLRESCGVGEPATTTTVSP
jgi:hypothetical protein